MKAYELRDAFGFDHLRRVERPDPVPGPGEVLLRILAVSINYRDVLMIRGLYNPRQRLPLIPLSDAAAEVLAIGEGVTRVRVGDRVAPTFLQGWHAGEPTSSALKTSLGGPYDGVLAERMVVSQEGVVLAPPHLSDEEVATLPCAALTAWSALVTYGNVKAGDTVVVQGTGGVSLFAFLFAQMHGARVIVTSRHEEKLERLRAFGPFAGIQTLDTPEWGNVVRGLTDGVGADHVVEVGGTDSLAQSIRAVRPFGRISLIGMLGGGKAELNVIPILMQNIVIQGILVGSRSGFEAMNAALRTSGAKPVVDRTFSFDETLEALHYLMSGNHFGKICIRLK